MNFMNIYKTLKNLFKGTEHLESNKDETIFYYSYEDEGTRDVMKAIDAIDYLVKIDFNKFKLVREFEIEKNRVRYLFNYKDENVEFNILSFNKDVIHNIQSDSREIKLIKLLS